MGSADEPGAFAVRGYGVSTREQLAGLSGVAMLQAMIDGKLPAPPITKTLDFTLVEVGSGARCSRAGRASPTTTRWARCTAAGSRPCSIRRSAARCRRCCPSGKAYTTAELKINIVRPLTDKVPLVRAEATIIHIGGRMATAEARLTGPTASCTLTPPPPASSSNTP
jgi:hypothetical protein